MMHNLIEVNSKSCVLFAAIFTQSVSVQI